METLVGMLRNKYPNAEKHPFFAMQSWKWVRQYSQIARLRNRRPEVYKKALIDLVDYIGQRCTPETEASVRAMLKRRNERYNV